MTVQITSQAKTLDELKKTLSENDPQVIKKEQEIKDTRKEFNNLHDRLNDQIKQLPQNKKKKKNKLLEEQIKLKKTIELFAPESFTNDEEPSTSNDTKPDLTTKDITEPEQEEPIEEKDEEVKEESTNKADIDKTTIEPIPSTSALYETSQSLVANLQSASTSNLVDLDELSVLNRNFALQHNRPVPGVILGSGEEVVFMDLPNNLNPADTNHPSNNSGSSFFDDDNDQSDSNEMKDSTPDDEIMNSRQSNTIESASNEMENSSPHDRTMNSPQSEIAFWTPKKIIALIAGVGGIGSFLINKFGSSSGKSTSSNDDITVDQSEPSSQFLKTASSINEQSINAEYHKENHDNTMYDQADNVEHHKENYDNTIYNQTVNVTGVVPGNPSLELKVM